MKVALTGHTSGIGKAIYESLTSKGYEVHGFSKSNGYPLPESITRLVQEVKDFDIFINNTYWGFAQALIMDQLVKQWANVPGKRIICMGSTSANVLTSTYPLYTASKKALESFCYMSQTQRVWPSITNLKLGMVDTPRTDYSKEPKLTPKEVSIMVLWILKLPAHMVVPEIVVKHRDQLTAMS